MNLYEKHTTGEKDNWYEKYMEKRQFNSNGAGLS